MPCFRFASLASLALVLSATAPARAEYSQTTLEWTQFVGPLQERALALVQRCERYVDSFSTAQSRDCKKDMLVVATEFRWVKEYLTRACAEEEADSPEVRKACFGIRDQAHNGERDVMMVARRIRAD